MKNLVRWLREIGRWVLRVPINSYYWWAIAGVGISIASVGTFGKTEQSFRLTGMCLQLGGVLTVVLGILKTRADFGQPTVRLQFKAWIKVFPRLHPPAVTLSVNGILSGLSGRGYLHTTHGPSADQTSEGRVTHLEGIVKKLEDAQGRTHVAVVEAQAKAQEALDAQARQLSGQIPSQKKSNPPQRAGSMYLPLGSSCSSSGPSLVGRHQNSRSG